MNNHFTLFAVCNDDLVENYPADKERGIETQLKLRSYLYRCVNNNYTLLRIVLSRYA